MSKFDNLENWGNSLAENKEVEEETLESNDKFNQITKEEKIEQIDYLDKEKFEVLDELNEIRTGLGIEPTSEVPPSVAQLEEIKDKLEKNPLEPADAAVEPGEKNSGSLKTAVEVIAGGAVAKNLVKKDGGNQEQNEQEMKMERNEFLNYAESLKELANIFKARIDMRLTPLVEDRGIGTLQSSADEIEEIYSKSPIDRNELYRTLELAKNVLASVGEVDRGSRMSENIDNLTAIINNLGKIKELNSRTIAILKINNLSETKDVKDLLINIDDILESRRSLLHRMRDSAARYFSR